MKISNLMLLFIVSACAAQTIAPKVSKAELEQEKQVQRNIVKQYKIPEFAEAPKITPEMKQRFVRIANIVGVAGEDLCNELAVGKCNFGFALEEDKALNAYADGKKIVITTAMMEFAKKDEELLNVVAHEYAHNVMGHISSKQGNAILGTLAGMAIDAAVGAKTGAADFGANLGAQTYSVDFEQEADYVGLYIFARTGYDPNQAIEFWRKMSQANEAAIDHGVTHPTNPARFVAMKKTIAEINYKRQNGLRLLPEFKKK